MERHNEYVYEGVCNHQVKWLYSFKPRRFSNSIKLLIISYLSDQ